MEGRKKDVVLGYFLSVLRVGKKERKNLAKKRASPERSRLVPKFRSPFTPDALQPPLPRLVKHVWPLVWERE